LVAVGAPPAPTAGLVDTFSDGTSADITTRDSDSGHTWTVDGGLLETDGAGNVWVNLDPPHHATATSSFVPAPTGALFIEAEFQFQPVPFAGTPNFDLYLYEDVGLNLLAYASATHFYDGDLYLSGGVRDSGGSTSFVFDAVAGAAYAVNVLRLESSADRLTWDFKVNGVTVHTLTGSAALDVTLVQMYMDAATGNPTLSVSRVASGTLT
jgi:hypothetical protein